MTGSGSPATGDSAAEIARCLDEFSAPPAYPVQHWRAARCRACGGWSFQLDLDEREGAATRTCAGCGECVPMADSADYLDDADLERCSCPCGTETFEVVVGVHLFRGSGDVRWVNVGCRCVACGSTGCYGDWKSESGDHRAYLSTI